MDFVPQGSAGPAQFFFKTDGAADLTTGWTVTTSLEFYMGDIAQSGVNVTITNASDRLAGNNIPPDAQLDLVAVDENAGHYKVYIDESLWTEPVSIKETTRFPFVVAKITTNDNDAAEATIEHVYLIIVIVA